VRKVLEQDTSASRQVWELWQEVSKGLFAGNNHTRIQSKQGRAGRSKLVSDKWSHIPWVRGNRYGMVHGSGMFLKHRVLEVSMPFGLEEGLSKPATRRILFLEPKAEPSRIQPKLGTFSGQRFGQKT
jgi:hypothetical protein